jgi:hypothetical protein
MAVWAWQEITLENFVLHHYRSEKMPVFPKKLQTALLKNFKKLQKLWKIFEKFRKSSKIFFKKYTVFGVYFIGGE